MKHKLLVACMAAFVSPAVYAQSVANVRVDDGTNATCLPGTAAQPAYPCSAPSTGNAHVDAFAANATGTSGLFIDAVNSRLDSLDEVNGDWAKSYTGVFAQGTAAGLDATTAGGNHSFLETQTDADGLTRVLGRTQNSTDSMHSTLMLETASSMLATNDITGGTFSSVQTNAGGAFIGHEVSGTIVSSIQVNADGNQLLGDTSVDGIFSVTGASILNGIDNQNAGITNAGAISGVTAGTIDAASTDAVNGSQLYGVQETANTALTNAATAQTTADTAVANAAVAQTTADAAQASADTAVNSAAAAQTTADSALATAATAQATADTAITDAAAAKATADSANASSTQALTSANTATSTANGASTVANSAYALATGMDSRLTDLEGTVRSLEYDINRVDRMAARGIAIATALASMPDLDDGKTAGFGLGVGSYAGRNAVSAAFILRASDSVKVRINAGTAGDGKFAVGAGGMFSW